MTNEERESIIAQLSFSTGWKESAFEKYTDEQLIAEMKKMYGESEAE